jgi:hypothetical protein
MVKQWLSEKTTAQQLLGAHVLLAAPRTPWAQILGLAAMELMELGGSHGIFPMTRT